jgi:diguanylate cyclase (GGDEF)-like protein
MDVADSDIARSRALLSLHAALGLVEDDLPALLLEAVRVTSTLVGDAAAVWTVTGRDARLRSVARDGLARLATPDMDCGAQDARALVQQVAHGSRTARIVAPDLSEAVPEVFSRYLERYGVSSLVLVPLVARGTPVGVLEVVRDGGRPELTDDEVLFLQQISEVVALTLGNGQLLEYAGRAQTRSAQLAREDALTGLLNRRGFLDALRGRLDATTGTALVAVLDMDGFKLVNDGFGHAAGDLVLTGMAARLCAAVPPDTVVGRIGGDEFALLVVADDAAMATAAIEAAVRACTGTMSVVGLSVPITVSVGTAVLERDAETALQHADLAMYRAKRRGGLVTAYEPGLDDPATRRLRDVLELRAAIGSDDLTVHYQPVVTVGGGALRVEALVRRRSGGVLLPPADWLDLADRAGLMPELTANVVQQVIAQLIRWWRSGLEVECAVNVPAPVLAAPELVTALLRMVDEAGLPRRALSVEVTEGDLVGAEAKAALNRCAAADIAVAVDDFGTGWSALSYLVDLPLRTLKIDRTFVEGVDVDPRRAAVVRAVVEVAHQLGLWVVAEGVETSGVSDALIDLGVDAMQGYLFARPASADDLEPLLRRGLVAVRR